LQFLTLVAIIATLVLIVVPFSRAADFSTDLSRTISKIPFGADVAAMGNTTAPDFSSSNPAITGMGRDYIGGVTATFGLLTFRNGPAVQIYSVSGNAKLPVGALQVTYSRASSGKSAMSETDDIQINMLSSWDFQYGLPVGKGLLLSGDELFAGVSYTHTNGTIMFRSVMADYDPAWIASLRSASTSNSLGFGLAYKPTKKLTLTSLYCKSWDRGDELLFDDLGNVLDKSGSKGQSDTVRFSASYQLFPLTLIAADYQHLFSTGINTDQYYFGIEQYIIAELLAVYGGWADGGWTTGLGIYFKHGGINAAVMFNPAREMDNHFGGESRLIMFSSYLTF
jgi:hypothetical protein